MKAATKSPRHIGDETFHFIHSKTEFQTWTEKQMRDHGANVRDTRFRGPGWYTATFHTQRCPRNCCDDYVMTSYEAQELYEERSQELREAMENLAALEALLLEDKLGAEAA